MVKRKSKTKTANKPKPEIQSKQISRLEPPRLMPRSVALGHETVQQYEKRQTKRISQKRTAIEKTWEFSAEEIRNVVKGLRDFTGLLRALGSQNSAVHDEAGMLILREENGIGGLLYDLMLKKDLGFDERKIQSLLTAADNLLSGKELSKNSTEQAALAIERVAEQLEKLLPSKLDQDKINQPAKNTTSTVSDNDEAYVPFGKVIELSNGILNRNKLDDAIELKKVRFTKPSTQRKNVHIQDVLNLIDELSSNEPAKELAAKMFAEFKEIEKQKLK